MRRITPLLVILLLLLASPGLAISPAAEEAAAQIQVTNLTIDPAVLMPYDTATVTLTIANTGTGSVAISRADILDKDIRIRSDSYNKVGAIGGGNTMRFTFTIQAGAETGIFYPVFSLDFRDANYLRYPLKVEVRDNPLEVAVLKKLDTYTEGKKEEIILHIGNPRDNGVNGVTVIPSTTHEITPTSFFVGVLGPDESREVPFTLTPRSSEPVNFTVKYQNGMNDHEVAYQLPIIMGASKKQANPVLSNVMIEPEKDFWRVTGDITNSGLETANAVEVTSKDPAIPIFPYKIYAVGALKPDDFSSFELTFRTDDNTTEVPLITSFKDDDGNPFSSETMIETEGQTGKKTEGEESGPVNPVMIGAIALIAIIVIGIIIYTRRR